MEKVMKTTPPRSPDKSGQAGFTLLEVMATVTILGIGIVMVIQLFSGGLSLVKSSDDYTRKVLVAREKMTETLLSGKLKEGRTTGTTDDGLGWAVEVRAHAKEANATVFKVVVSAEGPGARKKVFTLTTLKTVF